MLNVEVALRAVGYQYREVSGLEDQVGDTGHRIRVAGVIDPLRRGVVVSAQYPGPVMKFTVAHELGHVVLHPDVGVVHRDRAFNGEMLSHDPVEKEADRFATFFLMPTRLVTQYFRRAFGRVPFIFDEYTAFALGHGITDLERSCSTLRTRCLMLAGAERYNGVQIISMASRFGASQKAMAIRLQELELVK